MLILESFALKEYWQLHSQFTFSRGVSLLSPLPGMSDFACTSSFRPFIKDVVKMDTTLEPQSIVDVISLTLSQ